MFSFLSVKKVFARENRVAKQLPKLKWSMKNVLSQLDKLAPYLSQIFESVFRTLLKELNNNVNHVIWQDVVLEERRYLVHILAWAVLMKPLIINIFQDLSGRGLSQQELVYYCADWVNITKLSDFALFLVEVLIVKVLDFVLRFVDPAVALVNNVLEFVSDLSLLRGNVVSVSCPVVE